MKKCLSLVFAFIFAAGICFSAPVTASAATTDGLTFVLNSDKKSYSVDKYPESNITDDGVEWVDVVIPSKYQGLPVTKINSYAFRNCEAVRSIVIPDSVTVIESEAFNQCWYLSKITMSKNITKVGMWCFDKTKFYDTAKNWENGVLYCGNVLVEGKENIKGACTIKAGTKCIADSAFRFREKLTSVTIPGTVTHIGSDAFYGCALSKVVIPEGVVSVGAGAFGGNQKLTTITLPRSIKNLDIEVLVNCENLKTVNYNGTKAEWSKIKIHQKNSHLLKAKLVCTGKPLVLATPTVKIANTTKGIKVTWGAVQNAKSYIVYRSTYNASTKKWSKWATIKKGLASTAYVDGTVKLGTYYKYTVRAVNGSVMSSYKGSAGLKYNVIPTVKVANASNGVKVSWSTAANATGYTVYSSTYNVKTKKWSGWKSRGTAKATMTSWVDKAAKSGVYYKYTVRACYGKTIKSSYNKNGTATLYLAQPTVKIANASNGIKVSWNKVAGSKGYTVYSSEYVNGTWTSWKNRGTAQNTKTAWVDKNVVSGVQYKYTVRAINGNYKSTYKATGALMYLSQPTVKVAGVDNALNVTWGKVVGATGYTVYSSTYNTQTEAWSGWSVKDNVASTVTSFVDKDVSGGESYRYTVRAVNGNYKSSFKASNSVLFLSVPVANAEVSGSTIVVSWLESPNAYEYEVYRSALINGKWSEWNELTVCSYLQWRDYEVDPGVYYRYKVVAVNGGNRSTVSETEKIVIMAQPEASAELVENGIKVSWNKVAGAESYSVYRSVYNVNTDEWDTSCILEKSTSTSYVDTTCKFGEEYVYSVKAVSGKASVQSEGTMFVTYDKAPVVTATLKNDGVHVTWNAIDGANTYIVLKSVYDEKTGEWSDWSWLENNYTATEYVDKEVYTGSYKYSVAAKTEFFCGTSGVSSVVKCDVPVYVLIDGKKITFSDNAESLSASFGAPTEILVSQTSEDKVSYYVYSGNYSKLTIVTLTEADGVVSVYTLNSGAVFKTGFTETSFAGFKGESYVYNTKYSTEYFIDELGTKTTYAVMFSKRGISANKTDVSGNIKAYEKINFHCANACRAINGVAALSYNENVAGVARAHSQDMATRNYFAHETPEGRSPGDRLTSGGITWWTYGENIDAGYRTPFDMSDGWYNSSGHRRNMLNTNFTHLGVGIAYNSASDYGFYGTQNFVAF